MTGPWVLSVEVVRFTLVHGVSRQIREVLGKAMTGPRLFPVAVVGFTLFHGRFTGLHCLQIHAHGGYRLGRAGFTNVPRGSLHVHSVPWDVHGGVLHVHRGARHVFNTIPGLLSVAVGWCVAHYGIHDITTGAPRDGHTMCMMRYLTVDTRSQAC